MTPATDDVAVAIARLEAKFDGIKTQIDQADRNHQQVAKLTEERWEQRFNSIDRRLSDMDVARERARKDDQHARESIDLKHTALELRVTALEKVDLATVVKEVSDLKEFKTRVYAIAAVLGLAFGAAGTAIQRAIGG